MDALMHCLISISPKPSDDAFYQLNLDENNDDYEIDEDNDPRKIPDTADDMLFTVNDGIARTTITLQDIQNSLFETLGPSAEIDQKLSVELLSKNSGFNSKVVLLKSIWKNPESAKAKGWPENICAKLATLTERVSIAIDEREKHASAFRNYYDVEIDVYKQLKDANSFINMVASKKFTLSENKSFLLFEFVEGADSLNLWESIEDMDMIKVMKDLANFHALTPKWQTNDHRLMANKEYLMEIYRNRLADHNDLLALAKTLLADDVAFGRLLLLSEKMSKSAGKLFEKVQKLELPEVFAHADLWTENIMFQNGEYRTIIDFQMCHFNQIGFDFGRLFAFVATRTQRKNVMFFFDHYFEELRRVYPDNQITKDIFTKSWNLMYPFHYWIAVLFRAKRHWKVKDNEEAAERMRAIMKEEIEEALEGLELALTTYF